MSKRPKIKAAPGETPYDKDYSQDPAVHRPAVKAPVKPKVGEVEEDATEDAATSPQVSLRENADGSDATLAEPLKYIVSPSDAIEKVEVLLQKVKEGRPDLVNQVDQILKSIDVLEQGGQPEQMAPAPQPSVPGEAPVAGAEGMDQELSPGASVEVQAEEEIYRGILVDMNEDGTWDVQTDQNMVLSAVPAEAIRVVQAETFMSLPASLQLMQIKILGLKSAQSLQGLDLEEFLASKSPEELEELVAQWKARIAEVGPALEDSAFIQNAIARAEELSNEKHMPMAASKKEPTMKIKAEVEAGYTETQTKVIDEKGTVRLFNAETDDTQPLTIYQNAEGKLAAVAEDGSAEYEDKANDEVEIKFFQDVHTLMGAPAAEEKVPVAASKKIRDSKKFPAATKVTAASKIKAEWFVNVGNVGNLICKDEAEARATYLDYSEQSKSNYGRAAGETVALFHDDEIVEQVEGTHREFDASKKNIVKIKADFMEKQVFEGDGVEVETDQETAWFPSDESAGLNPDDFKDMVEGEVIGVKSIHGWWGRYSAPGYLDCTPWVYNVDKAACEADLEAFYGSDDEEGDPEVAVDTEGMPDVEAKKKEVSKQKLGAGRKSMLTAAKRADLKARSKKVTASKKEIPMKTPAAKPIIEASAFDKIPELDLGDGFKVRRKAGEKKPKEGAAPEAPKADAKPMDDKAAPGATAAPESPIPSAPKMPFGADLKAADFPPKEDKPEDKKDGEEKPKDDKSKEDKPKDDKGEDKPKDKKDEKYDGPMLEIIDKDGKVVETMPDAFGDDTVSIIKFLQQTLLPTLKKGDKKEEKKDGDKKDDKKEEKGEKKEEKKDDEKLEDKPKALPAVKVDKKDEKDLEASMKLMEQRVSMVRNVVKDLVAKRYVVADQRDIDEELSKQETGKESLEAAMNAAFDKATDRKFREILAMPDAELLTLRASLPSLSIKATQLEITASQEGLEPLDLLTVQASKAASAGEVSIGSAFGFSSFSK